MPEDYLYQVRTENGYVKVNSFDQLYNMMGRAEAYSFDFVVLRYGDAGEVIEVPLTVTLTKQMLGERFR